MKKILLGVAIACSSTLVHADIRTHTAPGVVPAGTYVDPSGSMREPGDVNNDVVRANDVYFIPDATGTATPSSLCETPASLACVYGLTPQVPGCPISGTSAVPNAGAGTTIAVVEGGDNSSQASDLQTYSTKYQLATPVLNIYVGANADCSTDPSAAGQSEQTEHVLDLEMIHALAQYATIDEVEAQTTNSSTVCNGNPPCSTSAQLGAALDCAAKLVNAAGGGFISDSYGGKERSNETQDDVHFNHPGAIVVMSSGDYSAPANYPASSPYVVGTGAISILRDANGNFKGESAWNVNLEKQQLGEKSGTSGGPSVYESRPPYQRFVQKIVGTQRGTPDVAADGDPATGPCVYSTFDGGWIQSGGTSAAAPQMAAIFDTAPYKVNNNTTAFDFLNYLYYTAQKNYHTYWHDGINGNNGYPAMQGYDFVTGLGSPRGYGGK